MLSDTIHDVNDSLVPEEGTRFQTWLGGCCSLPADGTHFGFVYEGRTKLSNSFGTFEVGAGGYFSLIDAAKIDGNGAAIIVSRLGWRGMFQLGGPIEERGRLRYIDGCSDTVLISPPKLGDPCLNLLHVPPGIDQTAHTHPSVRVGLVVAGSGVCRHPNGETPLTPGHFFILPTDFVHSFHTAEDELRIVVYHPDSLSGPSEDVHPMLAGTLVGGTPVAELEGVAR